VQGSGAQGPFWQGRWWRGMIAGMEAAEKRRWYCPTPGWLVPASLAVTGLLFLSERWRWFSFNAHKGWTVLMAVAGVGVVLLAMLLWSLAALVFRWRFQFGIRTLLVLVVAVALPSSWLAVEMQAAKRQREAVTEILNTGGLVIFSDDAWLRIQRTGSNYDVKKTRTVPDWQCRLFDYDLLSDAEIVAMGPNATDSDVKCISRKRCQEPFAGRKQ